MRLCTHCCYFDSLNFPESELLSNSTSLFIYGFTVCVYVCVGIPIRSVRGKEEFSPPADPGPR